MLNGAARHRAARELSGLVLEDRLDLRLDLALRLPCLARAISRDKEAAGGLEHAGARRTTGPCGGAEYRSRSTSAIS